MRRRFHLLAALLLPLAACGSSAKSDAEFQREIVANMNQLLRDDVQALSMAAHELRDAAPEPIGRGWDATDEAAIDTMKTKWKEMRDAWEAAEGILASIFPALDEALDARYEEYLESLGADGDPDLFDDQGVTGMHAVERILFAPSVPDVIAQESVLPGYVEAAWPATEDEATRFRAKLCTRLVDDVEVLLAGLTSGVTDLAGAFEGMTELIVEQKEKVSLAGIHVDESRYGRRTLADLRANLAGTRAAYDLFVPWLDSKPKAAGLNDSVQQAFDRLDQAYHRDEGDDIPDPPDGWNSEIPTATDQGTPFGRLYVGVLLEVDAGYPGSAVAAMNHVARMLGLPEFVPEP